MLSGNALGNGEYGLILVQRCVAAHAQRRNTIEYRRVDGLANPPGPVVTSTRTTTSSTITAGTSSGIDERPSPTAPLDPEPATAGPGSFCPASSAVGRSPGRSDRRDGMRTGNGPYAASGGRGILGMSIERESSRETRSMTTISIQEAQANLSELIHRLSPGDEIIITEDDRPVAKWTVASRPMTPPRPPGFLAVGAGHGPDFGAPLDDFKEYPGAMTDSPGRRARSASAPAAAAWRAGRRSGWPTDCGACTRGSPSS